MGILYYNDCWRRSISMDLTTMSSIGSCPVIVFTVRGKTIVSCNRYKTAHNEWVLTLRNDNRLDGLDHTIIQRPCWGY